jgi:hypothetical protein
MTLRQWFCGFWWGHADLRKRDGARFCLECLHCGRTTPGWLLWAARMPQERKS